MTYSDYSGGLNTQSAVYLLQGNQAREALNVHTSLTGDIEKRPGYVTLSGSTLTGSPCNAKLVHSLFPANTATKSLLGVVTTATTDSIVKITTAGVASNLKTGLTANTRWYWAQAESVTGEKGPIFGMNGVDTPQEWNGTASTTSEWKADAGEVPKGKFLTYWSERLWCVEKGYRVRFSGITGSTSDVMNWDEEEYVDIDPNDGQPITGLGIVGSYLVVFKARKTYVIYEPTSGANREISNSVGCVAPRSIVNTPMGLLFLSEDMGICTTEGVKVTPFSDIIKPTLDRASASPATQTEAAATLLGRRYFLSLSLGGTRNDHTIEYDMLTKSFWLHDCASNQFALLDPGGSPVLYSADSLASARVSKAFVTGVYTDHGEVYAGKSYYVTPDFAWGMSGSVRYLKYIDPHRVKRVRELRVDGVGYWNAYVATDFTEGWEQLVGETWEAGGATELYEEVGDGLWEEEDGKMFGAESTAVADIHYHTPALGRSMSFKYQNEDTNNFRVYSHTINIALRED